MPVRGLLPTKLRFGIKLAALNFKKLFGYLNSVGQCALIPQISYQSRNSGVGYYPKTELTMDICCFIRNFQGT